MIEGEDEPAYLEKAQALRDLAQIVRDDALDDHTRALTAQQLENFARAYDVAGLSRMLGGDT